MPIDWSQQTYLDHYAIRIRWPSPVHPVTGLPLDPANANGERIGEVISYGRDFALYAERHPNRNDIPFYFYAKRAVALINFLVNRGLLPSHRIIVIGAGFGYITYAFRHASFIPGVADDYPLTYGIDLSSYISTNYDVQKPDNSAATSNEIVFDDWTGILQGNRVKNKLQTMTGGFATFHVVLNFVTESFNPVTEATALDTMFTACEAGLVGTDTRRIVHIVDNELYPGEDGTEPYYSIHQQYGTTLMTLENWAALKPTHSWIGARTNQVILGVLA